MLELQPPRPTSTLSTPAMAERVRVCSTRIDPETGEKANIFFGRGGTLKRPPAGDFGRAIRPGANAAPPVIGRLAQAHDERTAPIGSIDLRAIGGNPDPRRVIADNVL